jgi:hypothetical protein
VGKISKTSGKRNNLRIRRAFPILLIVILLNGTFLGSIPLIGNCDPIPGSEFQVNTYTTNSQGYPSAAMDSNGNFVITWSSWGQDGDEYGVFAQRYNSTGIPQGSEFQVNTFTTGNQTNSSIAMDPSGNFIITWSSNEQDGSELGIFAQRFKSTGIPQGSEFQVNTFNNDEQSHPSIAMDSNGNFVIAWSSMGQDTSDTGIYAQRYNNTGAPQGSEFQVNSYTSNWQHMVSVAMNFSGNFVMAWSSFGQDGSDNGIYAQRYNNTGVPQGPEFQVNTYTSSAQESPSAIMDTNGNFVITWMSEGQDGDGNGIFAQRFNDTGVPQGPEFQVNTYATAAQELPTAAIDSNGDFVIAWMSDGQDGDGYGIYAQRFNSTGVLQGPEFQVNEYIIGNQTDAAIAMDPKGNFVISWESMQQDGDDKGTYARLFIQDIIPPTITDIVITPEPHEVLTIINISVNVTDNYQMYGAWIEIYDPDTNFVGNYSMLYDPANKKYYFYKVYDILGIYTYTIWANDTSDNWASYSGFFTIQDITSPMISDAIAFPDIQEIFGNVNITAFVIDNYQVSGIWIEIIDPDGNLVGNFSNIDKIFNWIYYLNGTYDILGNYTFTFWVKDASNNWASASGGFEMHDTTEPQSEVDFIPVYTISESLTLNVLAGDAVAVKEVELWYKKDDGEWTLYDNDTSAPWSWNFNTSITGGDGIYQFYSRANDTSGNFENMPLDNDTWTIADTKKPQSEIDALPIYSTITTFNLSASANDTNGIRRVELWYKKDTGPWTLHSRDTKAPWIWTFNTSTTGGDGIYKFYSIAMDYPGNYEDTPFKNDSGIIVDTTMPVITETVPLNDAKDVELISDITIIFSETMDTVSVENGFSFTDGESTWHISDGEATWITTYNHNDTLIFDPQEDFKTETVYTVTIVNSSKDLAGNNLIMGAIPNPWSFTTPPTEPKEKENLKPIISLLFTLILLVLGLLVAKKRPMGSKNGKLSNELFTFFTVVLPFVIAEIITGALSWITGALRVPSWLGIGMLVDLVILIGGLVLYLMIYLKGNSEGKESEHD